MSKAQVFAGATPVSVGGDGIGGTILLESAPPAFASEGAPTLVTGALSTYYRSVSGAVGASGTATIASSALSLRYDGGGSRANNYKSGGDGPTVRSTEYATQNHAVTFAARDDRDLLTIEAGGQVMPYQGFPNLPMDLTDNRGVFVNGHYTGGFDWGTVEARAYWRRTLHEMNFLQDKGGSANGGMPMNTDATDAGYSLKATIPLSETDTVRVGTELHHYALDDWWPAVPGNAMMGPLTFVNINDGRRDRLSNFAEWESKWTPAWSTVLGVRNDVVWSGVGEVQPYSWEDGMGMGMGMMAMANPDADAARAFNGRDRDRTDVNVDATALIRFKASETNSYELGYARKTRSPNLYERFAWGTGGMSSAMIGWFGDANGYVGDPDLKPETAHTGSVTASWHDAAHSAWEVRVTPYYSYVEDYIDVDRLANLPGGFTQLRFANHDAVLYGANLSARAIVADDPVLGRFGVSGSVGWVRGRNQDSGDALYHMAPLNAALGLNHTLGSWFSAVELRLSVEKDRVSSIRGEPTTPGFGLLDLRTGYQWENVRLDFGIENLFDQRNYQPLGGVGYADYLAAGGASPIGPLPGPGRSFNAGLTVKF
ncbi:TonB-dependent receptor [Skermanella stibiiresistens]|uniref:TonB-dependent receptor n=1 Tax=Skermanella stibiiresistens TaxID=913326 RepID=UPI0006874AC2|nr:TonB-dependent receptor [Skermanella stibiiresistens]